MLSRNLSRSSIQAVARPALRFYSAGATGAPRANPDAFNKREKASEDMYVLEHEKEKLQALKAALKKQREHLDDVEKQM